MHQNCFPLFISIHLVLFHIIIMVFWDFICMTPMYCICVKICQSTSWKCKQSKHKLINVVHIPLPLPTAVNYKHPGKTIFMLQVRFRGLEFWHGLGSVGHWIWPIVADFWTILWLKELFFGVLAGLGHPNSGPCQIEILKNHHS